MSPPDEPIEAGAKAFLPKGAALVAPPGRTLVWGLMALALVLNLSPWPDHLQWLAPDFVLLVLLYWSIRTPHLAGLGVAFLAGLIVDVERGMHLGLNALAFTAAAFVVLRLRRRLERFGPAGQALHLAPLLVAKEALVLVLGLGFGHGDADWRWLAGGVVMALLWLPLAWLLDRVIGRAAGPAE